MTAIWTVLSIFPLSKRCFVDLYTSVIFVISSRAVKQHPSARKSWVRTTNNHHFLVPSLIDLSHFAQITLASQKLVWWDYLVWIQKWKPVKKIRVDALNTSITNDYGLWSKDNHLICFNDSHKISLFSLCDFKLLFFYFCEDLTILH